jgi:SAM-dependent methyltransferase
LCAPETTSKYADFDIIMCFSVIHHFKNKVEFLNKLSRFCGNSVCIIEMDGGNFGKLELESNFYKVDYLVETNDPYGKGTKKRKTWACDNREFKNLKVINYITGRGVFGNNKIVQKREILPTEHTWLKTNLKHEFDIYSAYQDGFVPKLLDYSDDGKIRQLTIEFINNIGKPSIEEINRLYNYLKEKNLFIIDFVRDMILFDENNKIKLIDLESVFNLNENPIEKYLRKEKVLPYDTYEKQIDFLKRLYKL